MIIPWFGWLGAIVGTVIGVVAYVTALGALETYLRGLESPRTAQERADFAHRRSTWRRGILAAAIAICAATGYWIGQMLGATYGHALGGVVPTGSQF